MVAVAGLLFVPRSRHEHSHAWHFFTTTHYHTHARVARYLLFGSTSRSHSVCLAQRRHVDDISTTAVAAAAAANSSQVANQTDSPCFGLEWCKYWWRAGASGVTGLGAQRSWTADHCRYRDHHPDATFASAVSDSHTWKSNVGFVQRVVQHGKCTASGAHAWRAG